jgi:membrane-bound lytic murein transglycosylase D
MIQLSFGIGPQATRVLASTIGLWVLAACAPLAVQAPVDAVTAPAADSAVALSDTNSQAQQSGPDSAAIGGDPASGRTDVAAETEESATASVEAADPLRPETRVDFDDPRARIDLWSRVRGGYAIPNIDNTLVRKWEQYYVSRPDYVARMTERGGRYLFHVVEELQKRDMPLDLALLPFIESAFNPQAMSVARAAGMWQFIPSTGRAYELTQNAFRDDRRDVLASTRAALDYLQKLAAMFDGDWQLALAAYNWGEGNVKRALARKRDRKARSAYESLTRMPIETRNYLPKLQAVKNIVAQPEAFGVLLPPLENHPYFLSVSIDRDIDVELAARLAGMPLEEFQQLNPQMNRPVILAAGTSQILLTYDSANAFVRNLPAHAGPLASWTVWVAPKTLKPADAADLVGMSEAELRDVNRIPPNMLVRSGSTLVVPRPEHRQQDVSEHLAENGHLSLAPAGPALRRVTFKAGRRGDTVADIARRYRVSAEQVAHWNDVRVGASFRAGQNIVVMVPSKAGRSSSKPTSPTRPAARVRVAGK